MREANDFQSPHRASDLQSTHRLDLRRGHALGRSVEVHRCEKAKLKNLSRLHLVELAREKSSRHMHRIDHDRRPHHHPPALASSTQSQVRKRATGLKRESS
jgi:hypothetical protein